jgi:hypothetical protein
MGKKWNDNEIRYLIDNYSNMFNFELSKTLNRSETSIYVKANKLGLKKSETHKSKCISKRNKMVGRDLTYELLSSIAKKYKTRSEFQKNDPSAYSSSRNKKIIDSICSHMVSKSFSVPQIILRDILIKLYGIENITYNNRQVIKPYEIDVYISKYNIGFEYNGKRWHENNVRDNLKKIMCENNKITLITINERNREYVNDIKTQLIENINKLNLNITPEVISNILINNPYNGVYDIEDLRRVAESYDDFTLFYKNEQSIYNKLRKLGLLEQYTSHMSRKRNKRSLNDVIEKLNKYHNLKDLRTMDYGTYLYIMKNKLYYLISDLKQK